LSNIRVTHTGLLSFFIAIITIFSSFAFILIITRTLSQDEFGTWTLINGLLLYALMGNTITSYWSTRDVARNIESGKTALLGSMILSIGFIIIYLILSYFMGYQTNVDLNILLFSSILIPILFLSGTLTAINLGWKPHVISYGSLILGISQIFIALFLIYFLKMGVPGIIATVSISNLINILFLYKHARSKLKNPFNIDFLKSWIRLSWISLYPGLPMMIEGSGLIIFSLMTESIIGLAIWAVALVTPSIISHVGLISRAIYPKLLEGGDKHYLENNLTLLLYFNFLVTGLVIVFAKSALIILNPIYQDAYFILILLAVGNFFSVLTNVFIQGLTGNESIDLNKKATFRQYMKSKLFYPHTLRLIQSFSSILILPIGLIILTHNNYDVITLVEFWAITSLVTQIPLTFVLYLSARNTLQFSLNRITISKYLIVSIITFSIIFILSEQFLIYNDDLYSFVLEAFIFAILGISLYLIFTYILDSNTRILFKSIINEIINKIDSK
jgi:O-antigen/teichoic acid export membrane protein